MMRRGFFEYFDATRLTGNRRYRCFDNRLVVLQVEEEGVIRHAGTGNEKRPATRWRDARLEDLSIHEARDGNKT